MTTRHMGSDGQHLYFAGGKGLGEEPYQGPSDPRFLDPRYYDPNAFTHDAYREDLVRLRQAGFKSFTHGERTNANGKTVMLDHPLPASLRAAVPIAQINAHECFVGTFYTDPDNPFYDLNDPQSVAALQAVMRCGQKIGINIKPRREDGSLMTPDELEAKLSEAKTRLAVMGVIPDVYVLDVTNMNAREEDPSQFKDLAGMISATSDNKLPDGLDRKYLSDSNGMHLYGKNVEDHITEGTQHLRIAAHPQWRSSVAQLPYDRVMGWIGNTPERAKLYADRFLKTVHANRVIAGDGFDPKIDLVVRAAMVAGAPGFNRGGPEPQI